MSDFRLECPVQLDEVSGRQLLERVRARNPSPGGALTLDLSKTERIDSRGSAWIVLLADFARRQDLPLRWEGARDGVEDALQRIQPTLENAPPASPVEPGPIESAGGSTIGALGELVEFGELCIDAIYWTIIAPISGRGFRWSHFVDELYEMGVRAVPIVFLMNLLLGLIIAMLMARQAENYGIAIFVADVIVIGFARELAAIMTSVVVSARTGAAIAAELATMKVQEEIDALRGMGLSVAQFLVAPKLLAILVVMPCLTAIGMLAGLSGGALWGVLVLGFQPSQWYRQTLQAAFLSDFFQGAVKCFVFAALIALIGCHNGFRVSGGSRGVGQMTTRAVVQDIFMIITVDIFFAAAFYYIFV